MIRSHVELTPAVLAAFPTPHPIVVPSKPNGVVVVFQQLAVVRPGAGRFTGGANIQTGFGDPANGWYDDLVRAARVTDTRPTLSFGTTANFVSYSDVPEPQIAGQAWQVWAAEPFVSGDGTIDVWTWYVLQAI